MKELYKTLEVQETATTQEIKKAYRKLAKQYHPDKCSTPECEEKFKEINAANEVLSDTQKRAQYDRVGDEAFGQGGFHQYSQSHSQMNMDDILNQMFGGGGRGFGQREVNLDKMVRVRIPLEKAVTGGKLMIEGTTVTIPKGIGHGMKLRLEGKGNSHNGKTGDLYLQMIVMGDEEFELQGNAIHTIQTIDLKEAIFGGTKEINLYGEIIKLKIPKDTKYGQQLRVRDKGLKGDNLIVHVIYQLPKSEEINESDLDFLSK